MTSAVTNIAKFQKWRTSVAQSNAGTRIKLIRAGIPANVLVFASEYFEMPRAQFVKIMGMSPATAERKIKSRSLLGPIESERLERLAIIENQAEQVFGDAGKAKNWLTQKNLALGDTPLSMLDTETGAREVTKILGSIAYGGAV
ncbi:MAG: DUF2384 domain-containing protein [Gallionellaceae bacterium]|nr:DUF2384 domain-containing protein [Gallionellaceae bacterium]